MAEASKVSQVLHFTAWSNMKGLHWFFLNQHATDQVMCTQQMLMTDASVHHYMHFFDHFAVQAKGDDYSSSSSTYLSHCKRFSGYMTELDRFITCEKCWVVNTLSARNDLLAPDEDIKGIAVLAVLC